MGLYDKAFGTQSPAQPTLTLPEAFAAIAVAAVALDGYLGAQQMGSISSALSRIRLFRGYTDNTFSTMFDKLLDILQQDGINTLFNIARECLSEDLREAAFAMAADLLLADCVATQEEQDFLNDLYQALGISSDIGIKIMQVMLIKNRS